MVLLDVGAELVIVCQLQLLWGICTFDRGAGMLGVRAMMQRLLYSSTNCVEGGQNSGQ
jgi:hypothetical protein